MEVKIEPEMKVTADRALMGVLLDNLLRNAWKFTRKTNSAKIEFGHTEKRGHEYLFIKDNGAGFDQKKVEAIFEPFERLHSEWEFSGSGIGLATVDKIVQRHGGKVFAEGETGRGATIYFNV